MPSSEEYICLRKASLGEKKIAFNLDSSTAAFDAKLKNEYPKLDLAGGYVLMCGRNATCKLFAISPPYTVRKLKELTGQGKIFVRPLQQDLDVTPDVHEEDEEVIMCTLYVMKYMFGI